MMVYRCMTLLRTKFNYWANTLSEKNINNLDNFKNVMSQFPTGVAIATSLDNSKQPCGMTVSSFVSICLEPQIVMISVGKHLALAKAIESSQKYAINILSEQQDDIGMAFATKAKPMPDRFSMAGFNLSQDTSLPILNNIIAQLETKLIDRKSMGDHVLYFGEVLNCKVSQTNHSKNSKPIVYFNRAWAKLA